MNTVNVKGQKLNEDEVMELFVATFGHVVNSVVMPRETLIKLAADSLNSNKVDERLLQKPKAGELV